jgi:hypothetical protein
MCETEIFLTRSILNIHDETKALKSMFAMYILN